jgi:hypothetical protein
MENKTQEANVCFQFTVHFNIYTVTSLEAGVLNIS